VERKICDEAMPTIVEQCDRKYMSLIYRKGQNASKRKILK
jgi:hypothetical protein